MLCSLNQCDGAVMRDAGVGGMFWLHKLGIMPHKHFGKSDSIFVWFGTEAEGVDLCSHGAAN